MIAFSFPHDWSNSFVEGLQWLTAVLQSDTGAEQRLQQRLGPRRTFDYTVQLVGWQRAYFDMIVRGLGVTECYIPIAHDAETIGSTLAAGSSTILIDTDNREFVTGGHAIIRGDDPRSYEIMRIDQVIETGLTLIVPTQKAWPAGSRMVPLIKGKLLEQPQPVRKSDGVWIVNVKFMTTEPNEWPLGSNKNVLLNAQGLVVNAFNALSGRGDYFDQASGTSEGQLILAMGLMDAYDMLGDARALALAQRMLNATAAVTYDGVQPPATITQTDTFAPHWLFVVKKPIKSNVIHYDETFTFASGQARIPDLHGPTRLVFRALSPDYEFLWQNPFSALLSGTEHTIASYTYEASAQVTTVNLADSTFNGSLAIVYSSQNGNRLEIGQRYEAWPEWRPLDANETDCACDTLNWAYRAFDHAAVLFGSNPYYAAAKEATRQQSAIVYDINDARDWIKPSFTKNPFGNGSRFQFSTRSSPLRFTCDDQGNVLMAVSSGSGEAQYGNASIQDNYADSDTTIVELGSDRPCQVDVFIDTVAVFDDTKRYSKTLSLAGAGSLQTFTLRRTDFVNRAGSTLPDGSVVYTFGVDDKVVKNHTIIIGRVRQTPNLTIAYYPGAIPFTANFLGTPKSALIDWRGPIYMGYQSPRMWRKVGNTIAVANCVQLLADAQTDYHTKIGDTGPFTPVYYFPRADALQYGAANTFGFVGPDPNTGWGGYQYRPLPELAQLYFEDTGTESWHAQAKSIVMSFLGFLDARWASPNGPPTDYPAVGSAQTNYDEPHMAALIIRAALYIAQKDGGTIDPTISSLIAKAVAFWDRLYVSDTTSRMFGTFCADLTTQSWFGFWHGELMRTIAQLNAWATATSNAALVTKTSTWMQGLVTFADANALPPDDTVTFEGHPVLTMTPNYANDLNDAYTRLINHVDGGIALPIDTDIAGKVFATQSHAFFFRGRDGHAAMRDLFYTLKGRLVPVWLPSFMNDIELSQIANFGSATLLIQNIEYRTYGLGQFGRDVICVEFRDGTKFYHRIIAAGFVNQTTEYIELDAAISQTYAPAAIRRISFMALARLDQDSIDIEHLTDNAGVSTAGVVFKAVGDFRSGADYKAQAFPNYKQIG